MDWRLGLVMLGAIPALAGLFHLLTGVMAPLAGHAAALAVYWIVLGALILWAGDPQAQGRLLRPELLRHVRPPRALALAAFVPVVAVAWGAMDALGGSAMPGAALFAVAVFALVNGTLEELFWRGALLPAPDREGVVVAWALFTLWHLAPLAARGITVTGGPAGLLLGAGVMGAVWMALRLRTGALGAGIAAHVALDLFAFADLAARNWPAAPG